MATKQASTQQFTQIKDIVESVVLFEGGYGCLIIEVSSTNFALLSREEQDAKIGAYAAFLNSLTFPIQILVTNKRVNISFYITLLDDEINKIQNQLVFQYMNQYKAFVQQLVKQNIVLDKRFYIVLPYSYLEGGAVKTISSAAKHSHAEDEFIRAKATLHTKAEGIRNQLSRLNLQTKILEKEQLINLFHSMYHADLENSNQTANIQNSDSQNPK